MLCIIAKRLVDYRNYGSLIVVCKSTLPLAMMRWNSIGIAVAGEALTSDPVVVLGMVGPPTQQRYDGVDS